MSTFSLDIAAFIAKTKGNLDAVTRKCIIDVGSELVRMSPVGDALTWKNPPPPGYAGGRFKGAWMLGEGSAPAGALNTIDPSGAVSNARIAAAIPASAAGKKYFLVNNLPYAQRLEEGWSGQAPSGMVMITTIKWRTIVDNAVNGVRAGTSAADYSAGFKAYPT